MILRSIRRPVSSTGPARTPEQRVVGRQPGEELPGVVDHDFFLFFDSEKFIKGFGIGDLDRLEKTRKGMAAPVGSSTGRPVNRLAYSGEQLFHGTEHTFKLGNNFGFQHHLFDLSFMTVS